MDITFSPIRSDSVYLVEKRGDCLIIDGEEFDFVQLKEGETIPSDAISSDVILGEVSRANGVLKVNIIRPYTAASFGNCFPATVIGAQDGRIL